MKDKKRFFKITDHEGYEHLINIRNITEMRIFNDVSEIYLVDGRKVTIRSDLPKIQRIVKFIGGVEQI